MTALLWAVVAVPAALGALLALGGRALERVAVPVAVATAAVVLGLALAVAAGEPSVAAPFVAGSTFSLAVDGLSAPVVVAVAAVSLLVIGYAAAEGMVPRSRFHGLMLIFLAAVMATATATTLPALLFAWEVMGAASYALIGFHHADPDRVSSGLTAFLTTRTADLGLYLAAGAALAGGGTLSIDGLGELPPGYRDVVAAGVLVAALGKAAQLPFSFWLSRAMAGPSPVSALLHSAAMVAMGGYLLLRSAPLLQATGWAGPVSAWIGAGTALLMGAVAVAQRDLKQVLAASTAAQLGFVVLAAGLGAVAGGAAHLLAHAATKALLFLVAGAWLSALGTKKLDALRGAARRWPVTGAMFTVGALSLAGVAPLSLWATKDHALAAALADAPALYVVGLAAAGLSAAYAGKILLVAWDAIAEHPAYDTETAGTREITVWQQLPLVPLTAGAGVLGLLVLPAVAGPVTDAIGLEAPPAPGAIELVASAALALVVVGLVFRFGTPEPAWASRWLGLGRATSTLVTRPTLALAGALARVDDRGLDRAVHATGSTVTAAASQLARLDDGAVDGVVVATAAATTRAGQRLASVDTHVVDGAVEGFARGARELGARVPRVQTGQLHHYYVHAVIGGSAALLLVLIVR
ncbi:proton-conducting transporter membrane subunit [Dietzia alimentaria]|uniref:proton-conducting transporter transmembrane domain-containing protein n=1 Tax=Dietzia alimentaria TaxID=665550 RepID=UPI00029B4F03|nr:proton-conducting transporter membrane subunit [Dietzia alimentaria]